jgi:hypothetical protein
LIVTEKYGEVENNKWVEKIKVRKLEEQKSKENLSTFDRFIIMTNDIELFQ